MKCNLSLLLKLIVSRVCRNCATSGRLITQSSLHCSTLRHPRNMSLRRTGSGLRWAVALFYILCHHVPFCLHYLACTSSKTRKDKFSWAFSSPQDGIVLHLVYSARKTADDILKKINKSEKREKEDALDKLAHLSNDITFAIEFINKNVSQISFLHNSLASIKTKL